MNNYRVTQTSMNLHSYFESKGKGWIADSLLGSSPELLTGVPCRARSEIEGTSVEATDRVIAFGPNLASILDAQVVTTVPYVLAVGRFQDDIVGRLLTLDGRPLEGGIEILDGQHSLGRVITSSVGAFIVPCIGYGNLTIIVECPAGALHGFPVVFRRPEASEPLRRYIETGGCMWFMKIVSLYDGTVYGYEALARDLTTMMFPARLFAEACAKGTLLTAELDVACMKTALEQATQFGLANSRKVFLNVSPTTFDTETFREYFQQRELPLPPSQIVFEIKEGISEEQAEAFRDAARPLFRRGFGFAVDDQGAKGTYGRSLLFLRPGYVKADWHFVADSLRMGMFHTLVGYQREVEAVGGRMIIEGVAEDWGSHDLGTFYDLGISFGQGFLFGKAEPVETVGTNIDAQARNVLERVWSTHTFAMRRAA